MAKLNGDIEDALKLHLLDDRHQQTLGGVHGQTNVVVAVVNHFRAVLSDGGVQHGVMGQSLVDASNRFEEGKYKREIK